MICLGGKCVIRTLIPQVRGVATSLMLRGQHLAPVPNAPNLSFTIELLRGAKGAGTTI